MAPNGTKQSTYAGFIEFIKKLAYAFVFVVAVGYVAAGGAAATHHSVAASSGTGEPLNVPNFPDLSPSLEIGHAPSQGLERLLGR